MIFFIAAPLTILYATGYRFFTHGMHLVEVGAIYAQSNPSGASIALDGDATGKSTPARFLNMAPGEHVVTISLKGYTSWKKKLVIKSSETTFITDVQLFPSAPARQSKIA